MTDEEQKSALSEIRDQLQKLATTQMMSARDVTRIRLQIEALAENLQANWDKLGDVRAEIERQLHEEK